MPHMTRRDFLTATGATLTLGSLGLPALAAGPKAGEPPSYTLGCYTRPWDQHEYRVALDGIAEAGYKYAGIMTAKGKSWVMITPRTTPEEAARVAEEVKQRGLKTLSVYGDFSVTQSLSQGITELKQLIDHCETCGSPNLLLGGTGDEKLYPHYVKAIAECCPYAATKKVALGVKPHGGRNATGPQCRKMIEQVNQRNFGVWYDPGNIFYYSEGALNPVDDCPSVADLVRGMSVKDFKRPKEVLVTPGEGEVDFKTVLSRLHQGGFRSGPLVVECLARGEVAEITAAAKKTRLFLQELINRLG